MSALAAIAIFPVLILLLVALTRAENMLGGLVEDVPSPLRAVTDVVTDVLNDAPTGDALPVPQLRLVEVHEDLAA